MAGSAPGGGGAGRGRDGDFDGEGDGGVPRLPIKLNRVSNGEYVPPPLSPVVQEAIRRTLDLAERNARRAGMDRRRFLQTLCGAATTLFALSACSKEEKRSRGADPGGTFAVPESSTTEPEAAREVLGGDEFVFDVQTHLLDYDLSVADTGGGLGLSFPYAACGEDDWRACFGVDHWLEEIFLRSDTTMGVISAIPVVTEPNPLSIAAMEKAKRAAERLCGDGRVLMHGQVNPNVGELQAALDGMAVLAQESPIAAWKVYTHVPGGSGWRLDDADPDAVRCGQAFLDQVMAVGPPIVCVHKGFGFGVPGGYESPADVGPAARDNPDLSFVVYHSGFDTNGSEGPYSPDDADTGVNRLIKSLDDAGIGPGENVYAELGSTWFMVMRDPTQAAHVLGKLLVRLGEDRVVWGTDSIWYGTPQDQIQALRTFHISEELQDRYGYPALTDEIKRKIFGLTSARLYGVDPQSVVCESSPQDLEELEELRESLPPPRTYGPEISV